VKSAIIKAIEDAIGAQAFMSYTELQQGLSLAQAAYIEVTKDKGPASTEYNNLFLQECNAISDRQQLHFRIDAAAKQKADLERKNEEERVRHNMLMQQQQAEQPKIYDRTI